VPGCTLLLSPPPPRFRPQVTRERIRQIEAKALRKMRALQTSRDGLLAEYIDGELETKQLAGRSAGYAKKSKG